MKVISIVVGALETVPNGKEKRLEELKLGEEKGHEDCSIYEVGQNTQKSPKDLSILAVIQILVKYYYRTLVVRTHQEGKIIKRVLDKARMDRKGDLQSIVQEKENFPFHQMVYVQRRTPIENETHEILFEMRMDHRLPDIVF